MNVLVVNAGSSSLKLRLIDGNDEIVRAADLGPDDVSGIADLCRDTVSIGVVGHRVVHGGHRFRAPVVVDDEVIAALTELVPLAPLHQPAAIAGIRAVATVLPEVPAAACFDTAFHATIADAAATYPLPRAWRERFGLRRFGFHGLSHAYASRRAQEVADITARRIVTCHLGAGSSLAAVVDGVSVDTTMGFTPNEGIPMATRSGSVDVGMLMWLLAEGVPVTELDDGLQHRSGLAGLAGTPDMRTVVERAAAGDHDAQLAIDVWLHRLTQAVAAMAASAAGIDLLVFTGRIGEAAGGLRRSAVERLGWLNLTIDAAANAAVDAGTSDAVISPPGAQPAVVVVHAREDLEIARAARAFGL